MQARDNFTIHNIELSKTGLGMSGGETCLVEVIKHLDKTCENVVYVPENGKIVYEINGLKVKYKVISKYSVEKRFGVILAYSWRMLLTTFKIPKFDRNRNNIIISHSDFLPTVWYAFLMKLRNPEAKWLAFCHMFAPNPFKGYEGEFTGKIRPYPSVKLILYQISQKLFFFLAGLKADKALFVNPYYGSYLNRSRLKGKWAIITLGTDAESYINDNVNSRKIYDGIFIGRYHPQKGIFDLIDICRTIVDSKPDYRLAIVGSGTKQFENKLKGLILRNGLEKNIDLLGYKKGQEKYNLLLQSRIFLFPSYYESFGIVAIEAMRCGLPVVAYNLPVFEGIFNKGMIKVPVLDNASFAQTILKLLIDQKYYDLISHDAKGYAIGLTWEATTNQINNIISDLCGNQL